MHPRMIYKTFNPELPRQTKCSIDLLFVYSNKQLNRTYRMPLSFVLPCQWWMVLSVTRLLSSEPCNLLCCQQMRAFHVNLRLLSQSQRWTGCDSYIWMSKPTAFSGGRWAAVTCYEADVQCWWRVVPAIKNSDRTLPASLLSSGTSGTGNKAW